MASLQGTEATYNTNSSSLFNVWGGKKITLYYLFLHPHAAKKGSKNAADLCGKRAFSLLQVALRCWNSLFPFFPSRSSSSSAASPCKLLSKVTGKQKAAENGDWSSSGFRRTAAPASTKAQILHRTQNKTGKWIKNTEWKTCIISI